MSDTTVNTKDTEPAETTEAPEKDPNMVTFTLDGQEVTVPKGTNVLDAARSVGTEISAFCYHPGLSVAACCRQCLVTVEKSPKPLPSCQTEARDGLVVETKDEASTRARQQLLEFTLVNHPIDCPICDKAGECTLQSQYFDYDNLRSRMDVPKVRKPKRVDLGPHVVLDAERCIMCTRCIRVCDEVAESHQLEMSQRGDHTVLGTAPGAVLDHPYSLCTVDVCPVGALTSKDYRFTMRAWELMMTPTICQGCATGCNIELHHKNGRAWRIQPRCNPDVNQYWMCDEGRFTYHELREDRLAGSVVDGLPAATGAAVTHAASLLRAALESDRGSVGVVFSPNFDSETNYVLAELATKHWQIDRLYVGGKRPIPDRADGKLMDADINVNTAGLKAVLAGAGASPSGISVLENDLASGELKALLVLGHHVELSDEVLEHVSGLDALVAISWREVGIVSSAHVTLGCASWAEADGTTMNRQGMVQRTRAALPAPGQAVPAWQLVAALGKAMGAAVDYDSPNAIFTEMSKQVEAFAGKDWGKDVLPIQLRWANSRG